MYRRNALRHKCSLRSLKKPRLLRGFLLTIFATYSMICNVSSFPKKDGNNPEVTYVQQ